LAKQHLEWIFEYFSWVGSVNILSKVLNLDFIEPSGLLDLGLLFIPQNGFYRPKWISAVSNGDGGRVPCRDGTKGCLSMEGHI
jgi:hypothetical protein